MKHEKQCNTSNLFRNGNDLTIFAIPNLTVDVSYAICFECLESPLDIL